MRGRQGAEEAGVGIPERLLSEANPQSEDREIGSAKDRIGSRPRAYRAGGCGIALAWDSLEAVKRLVELTVEDLVASPVWRYEGGNGSDAVVAPARRDALSQEDDEVFLAATEFQLFDSTRHFGFCFPADDSGIDYLQPVIVQDRRHVAFWFDGPAASEILSAQWKNLGKDPSEIFPVTFRCLVPVDGRIVTGRIPGIECVQPDPAPPKGAPAEVPQKERAEPAASAVKGFGETVSLAARPIGARRRGAASEKRTARRRKAEMPVEFSQGGFQGTGVTGDVSRRGMFIRSNRIPGAGPVLRLTVNLPEGRKLVLTGRVVRSAGPGWSSAGATGFGLRLADEWPEYEDLFSRLRNKPD